MPKDAKAAAAAAVKAAKKKKSGSAWWMPGRKVGIGAAIVVLVAIGVQFWNTLPISLGSKKIAQAEKAFMSGNMYFEQVGVCLS